MKNIFNEAVWDKMRTQGYYKPGVTLDPKTVSALRAVIDAPNSKGTPWSEFLFTADDKAGLGPFDYNLSLSIKDRLQRFKHKATKKLFPSRTHRSFARYAYRQSLYSSSDMLPKILEEMLTKGFADHFSDNPLLVGHDIYLENTDQQFGFGFHEDGWSLELLYNTDDDVSIYVPLQDNDESTGGRLHVDPNFATSEKFKFRNRAIIEFTKACQDLGCVDANGYVVREKVVKSKAALKEFRRLRYQRAVLPPPKKEDMVGVESNAGEVILFPNLYHHAGEQWKPGNEGSKGLYFVAFMPLYNLKLRPPTTFLNGEPCCRYVLDTANARVIPIDPNTNPIPEYGIPMPESDS